MSLYSQQHIALLEKFLEFNVKFMLIGGHAAIYYGVNRNTGDIDILVEGTAENGKKIIQALSDMKLELPDITSEEFSQRLVLSFGLEPDAVDILNYTPGIDFGEAYKNSRLVDFERVKVPMIDIRDLIRNKENLNRSNEKGLLDKYDVEVLKKILKSKTD